MNGEVDSSILSGSTITFHMPRSEGRLKMRTDVTKVRFVDRDELKLLWRVLERLQADVTPHGRGCGYVWRREEVDALVTVMDAVKDTYQTPPLTDAQKEEIEKRLS
jgi:hypothetical protein